MLAAMLSIALVLLFAYLIAYRESPKPYDLYQQLFYHVNGYFYEPKKMKSWDEWVEHAGKDIESDGKAISLAAELVSQLNDPYTVVYGPDLKNSRINFECTECVGIGILLMAAYENVPDESCQANSQKTGASCTFPTIAGVLYNSPAAHVGLKAGDLLTHVDDWSTAQQPLSEVLKRIGNKFMRTVTITIEREGSSRQYTLKRQFLATPTVWGRKIDNDIAYIRLRNFEFFSEAAFTGQAHSLRKCKAVIVDVRDNPGGEVDKGIRLPTVFMKSGFITTTNSRVFGKDEYLTKRYFVRNGTIYYECGECDFKEHEYIGQNLPDPIFAGKPIVVLVNENSASAAEMFAGALRDSAGAVLVGTKTFGKGVTQAILNLFGGVTLRITSGKYYLPSGYWPGDGAGERKGIDPDLEVPPQSRLFDLGSDEDNQLRAAIELLRQKLK